MQTIEASGGQAQVIEIGVRQPQQVVGLVERVRRETDRLDVMVNNAGVGYLKSIIDGDPSEWRDMLETNVLGLLVGCQAAVRAKRETRTPGHIVNISSVAAQRPDSGVYGATKRAVNCICATLRRELESDAIRAINIMPGAIATNFSRHADPAFLANLLRAAGVDSARTPELKRGQHLPHGLSDQMQPP